MNNILPCDNVGGRRASNTTKHEEVSDDKKVIVMALAARSGCVTTVQSKYASALPPLLFRLGN